MKKLSLELLSNAVVARRKVLKLSQTELAKATGISPRTIQNYEMNARLPKKRETYTKLAEVLGMSEETLLDENASFVLRASEQYGSRGLQQALDMVHDIGTMWAGGEMEEEDMDTIMQAMQEAYWIAKKNNRKYVNKRYRTEGETGNA